VCVCGTGGYATDAFEDVGHSTDARELMKKYAIGKLAEVSVLTRERTIRLAADTIRFDAEKYRLIRYRYDSLT